MQSFVPPDAFALKIQRELCHPKCARKVSGLSRNRPLATKHASLAISASKHGGQLVNEFFTYLKDITLNPGYFERMENISSDCCHPWTENPSSNSCSRQLTIVTAVVTLIASGVRSIDRSLFFSKLKLLILRQ